MNIENDKYNEFRIDSGKILNGYLVCHNCHGYYELKDNESPEDFSGCECGSPLIYTESIGNSPKSHNNSYNNIENEELEEMVDYLKNEARERKKLLKNLSERITIREHALNDIHKEKFGELGDYKDVWDLFDEKDIDSEINEQKNLTENIIKQEDELLSRIQQKRRTQDYYTHSRENRINPTLIIGIIAVLILLVIIIFFLL